MIMKKYKKKSKSNDWLCIFIIIIVVIAVYFKYNPTWSENTLYKTSTISKNEIYTNTTDRKENIVQQLDRQIIEAKEYKNYLIDYLKTTTDDESEKGKARELMKLVEEFIQNATNYRNFFNDDGTRKSDVEYARYIANQENFTTRESKLLEEVKEESSEINNDIKNTKNAFDRGFASAEYLQSMLKINSFGKNDLGVHQVLDDNMSKMKGSINEVQENTESWDEEYMSK